MFDFMKKKDSGAASAVKAQKSKGFYLELEEATGIAPAPKTTPSSASTATAPEAIIAPEIKVEVAPETTAPAKTPQAKAPRESKKVTAPTPTPEPVANVVPEPEILPAYLQMNDTPRRRPGANMTMFKNMAQQVGTSKN